MKRIIARIAMHLMTVMSAGAMAGPVAQTTKYQGPAGKVYEGFVGSKAKKLELCLMLDASASMSDDVENLRKEYELLARDLAAQFPNGIRTRVLNYGLSDGDSQNWGLLGDAPAGLGRQAVDQYRTSNSGDEFEVLAAEEGCLPFFSNTGGVPTERRIIALTDEPATGGNHETWMILLPKLAKGRINYQVIDPANQKTYGPFLNFPSEAALLQVDPNPDRCEGVQAGSALVSELTAFAKTPLAAAQAAQGAGPWRLVRAGTSLHLVDMKSDRSLPLPADPRFFGPETRVLNSTPKGDRFVLVRGKTVFRLEVPAGSSERKIVAADLTPSLKPDESVVTAVSIAAQDGSPERLVVETRFAPEAPQKGGLLCESCDQGPYSRSLQEAAPLGAGLVPKESIAGVRVLRLWERDGGIFKPKKVLHQAAEGSAQVVGQSVSKDGKALFIRTQDGKVKGIQLND